MPSDRARSRTASTALRRFLLLCLLSAPVTAAADVHLLDQALTLRAAGEGGGRDDGGSKGEDGTRKPEEAPGPATPSPPVPPTTPEAPKARPDSLDFDLLGAPPKEQAVDESALRLRRTMLTWHQAVGLTMFALQLATTVVGQLNYNDKFGGDNTAKYVQPHAILAYSTLATFVASGTLAILAPKPFERESGFDRVSLHKVAMFTAAGGMLAQAILGIWTQSREGYLNQQTIGTAHLAIGYVTLAAVATGIGAIVL